MATVNGGKRRSNKQQIGTNPPREIAARWLPAPLGVGRVGAAVLGAAGADVEEGAVPGVVERVAAVRPHPLPVEQVALVLIARRRYLPSRLSRLGRNGDHVGPEPPGCGHQCVGRVAE